MLIYTFLKTLFFWNSKIFVNKMSILKLPIMLSKLILISIVQIWPTLFLMSLIWYKQSLLKKLIIPKGLNIILFSIWIPILFYVHCIYILDNLLKTKNSIKLAFKNKIMMTNNIYLYQVHFSHLKLSIYLKLNYLKLMIKFKKIKIETLGKIHCMDFFIDHQSIKNSPILYKMEYNLFFNPY